MSELKPLDKTAPKSPALLMKILMNEKNFKTAASIENKVPDLPGLYAIRINNVNYLPQVMTNSLNERKHNLLFIGIATQSLKKGFTESELVENGYGSFYRYLGAALGFRPEFSSLINAENKREYSFTLRDNMRLKEWILENLLFNFVAAEDMNLINIANELIAGHHPLMNMSNNPKPLFVLRKWVNQCIQIANNN